MGLLSDIIKCARFQLSAGFRSKILNRRNCACAVKIPKICKNSVGRLQFTSYRKSMWLNPLSARYSRPEVELMYLLRMHRHCHKVAEMVSRLYWKTGVLNSNTASDFKPEVVISPKLCMRITKSPQLGKRQRRTVQFSTSYRKSMLLNPFPVRFTTGSRNNALTAHAQTLLSCLKQAALDRLRVRLNAILSQLKPSSVTVSETKMVPMVVHRISISLSKNKSDFDARCLRPLWSKMTIYIINISVLQGSGEKH